MFENLEVGTRRRLLVLLPAAAALLIGLSGCGDGSSGDAGTVNLSASQEAASRKGDLAKSGVRGSMLADKPLTGKKASK